MKLKRGSASCLKTFKKCTFAFFLNYIAKIRQTANEKMVIGNVVHTALEGFANGDLDYKKSVSKAFKKYKLAEIAENEEQAFNRCIMLTEEVLNRKVNPITSHKVLGVEMEFKTEIDGVPFIGYLDLLKEIESDAIVEILDYKSGSYIQTYAQVYDDLQPKIYDLAVKELYPDCEIWVTLDYILGTPVTVIYSDEEREENRREIISLIKKIQAIDRPCRRRKDWMCKAMCIGREECDKLWSRFYTNNFIVDEPEKKKDDKNGKS